MTDRGFSFLYRRDEGVIDRSLWARATAPLVVLFLVALWLTSATDHAANSTLRIGVIAIFLIVTAVLAACFYFISAKRFRDRGRPVALALALPAALFAAAALHWAGPQIDDQFPRWIIMLGDVATAAVAAWCVVELGFMRGRAP